MSETVYETFKRAAAEASERAQSRPSATSHRRAASAHLAAGIHASAIGDTEAMQEHDEAADSHIAAMKSCQMEEA